MLLLGLDQVERVAEESAAVSTASVASLHVADLGCSSRGLPTFLLHHPKGVPIPPWPFDGAHAHVCMHACI